MYIEEALQNYLNSQLLIKIYPIVASEGAEVPYITYQRIGGNIYHALQNDLQEEKAIFQLSIYASTLKQVKDIDKQVKTLLQNYNGTLNDVTIGSVLIGSENCGYNNETKEYELNRDYNFIFKE
jgi:hypothetical protein